MFPLNEFLVSYSLGFRFGQKLTQQQFCEPIYIHNHRRVEVGKGLWTWSGSITLIRNGNLPSWLADRKQWILYFLWIEFCLIEKKLNLFSTRRILQKITGKSSTIFKKNVFILREICFLKTEFELRFLEKDRTFLGFCSEYLRRLRQINICGYKFFSLETENVPITFARGSIPPCKINRKVRKPNWFSNGVWWNY